MAEIEVSAEQLVAWYRNENDSLRQRAMGAEVSLMVLSQQLADTTQRLAEVSAELAEATTPTTEEPS